MQIISKRINLQCEQMTWIVVKRRCSGGHFRQVIQGLVTTAIEYLDCWVGNIQDFSLQVGHETTYASNGNHQSFTLSCHHHTYKNYRGSPQR